MKLLQGRMNRVTYWVGLIAILALYAILNFISKKQVAVSEVVLILVAVPRLHDIGKSGWWAGAAFILEIAVVVAGFTMLPPNEALMAMGGFVLVVAVLLIWLGCVGGDAEPNKFGEPPAPGFSFGAKKLPQS